MATAKKPLAGLGKRGIDPQKPSSYVASRKTEPEIKSIVRATEEQRARAAAEEEQRKQEQAQKDRELARTKILDKPILTKEDALAFLDSDVGKMLPLQKQRDSLNRAISGNLIVGIGSSPTLLKQELDSIFNELNAIRKNPTGYVKSQLPNTVGMYLYLNAIGSPDADKFLNDAKNSVALLSEYKVPAADIDKLIESGKSYGQMRIDDYVEKHKPGIMDYAFPVFMGMMTGAAGLSAIQAAAFNTFQALAHGAEPIDALKSGIANLAASEVGEYLQTVKGVTTDPIIKNAATNAIRNAASASVLGQDVKTAALSGLVGGAVAGTALKASDNAAISRAVGEYTQGVAAGMSPEAAMAQALSGFADEEVADARRKVQDRAAIEQAKIDTQKPAQDQVIEAFSQPKSPGVGTQLGEATAELAGGIQYGSRPGAQGTDIVSDVNLPSIPVKPVIPSDVNTLPTVEVVASPGEFGADLIRPTTPSRDTDILNLTGLRPAITPPSGVSVTAPTLPDITIPTAPTAPTQPIAPTPPTQPTQPTQPSTPITPPAPTQPPATDQMLPGVEVTGDRDRDILNLTGLTRPTTPTTPQEPPKPSLPEVEVVGEPLEEEPVELKPDTEAETKPTKPPVEEEPGTKPTRPILLSLLNLPTAYLGDRPGEMRPGTAALAQALGVGDPGALYLGKKGKERKPVWNVESLKLKDELGGDYG